MAEDASFKTQTALFFDFDGTLSHLVETPDKARLAAGLSNALDRARRISDGAIAIVSGRSISQLDDLLAPLELAVSGVHGLERRSADGTLQSAPYDADKHLILSRSAQEFAEVRTGVLAEIKPGSVALHYRQAPQRENECIAFADHAAEEFNDLSIMRGKMVVEMRFGQLTKGDAVRAFMAEAPFAGRTPIFFGDDVTDEHAFAAADELGGYGVKIGNGETVARFRFADIDAFHDWLRTYVKAGASPRDPTVLLAEMAGNDLEVKQEEQEGA